MNRLRPLMGLLLALTLVACDALGGRGAGAATPSPQERAAAERDVYAVLKPEIRMGDHPEDRGAASRYRLVSLVCVLVLLAMQVVPLPVASGLLERCNAEHHEIVERVLVPALETYRRDHGEYPDYRMQELVPGYLATEPLVACAAPARQDAGQQSGDGSRLGDFALGECYHGREGEHFVYYSDMDAQVYNLTTHTWSGYDPWDGPFEAACRVP